MCTCRIQFVLFSSAHRPPNGKVLNLLIPSILTDVMLVSGLKGPRRVDDKPKKVANLLGPKGKTGREGSDLKVHWTAWVTPLWTTPVPKEVKREAQLRKTRYKAMAQLSDSPLTQLTVQYPIEYTLVQNGYYLTSKPELRWDVSEQKFTRITTLSNR